MAGGSRNPRVTPCPASERLFETSYVQPQLRLFALDEAGWLKPSSCKGTRHGEPLARWPCRGSFSPALTPCSGRSQRVVPSGGASLGP